MALFVRFAQIGGFLSRTDFPRSADHRRRFALVFPPSSIKRGLAGSAVFFASLVFAMLI